MANKLQQLIGKISKRESRLPLVARVFVWLLGVPSLAIILVYGRLLFGPIEVNFIRAQAEDSIRSGLPANSDLEIGSVSLSTDNLLRPVLRFSSVVITDHNSGADIKMKALEIGFSPVFALIGQPGARVKMVEPKIQFVQDLLGPRLARFELVDDSKTGETLVRILEGQSAYPSVGIMESGLTVRGAIPDGDGVGLRSDNDWLVQNIEANEKSLADLIVQAEEGRFSKLEIQGGKIEMLDPVYGLIKEFSNVQLSIVPNAGGSRTKGQLSATLAGQTLDGTFERSVEADGGVLLAIKLSSLDFAAMLPVLDDPDAIIAVSGHGSVEGKFRYEAPGGRVISGDLNVDAGGTKFRIQKDLFPVVEAKLALHWRPAAGRFTLDETRIAIGKTTAMISGDFLLGLDDVYGPTIGMTLHGRDLSIQPLDLGAPESAFAEMAFSGWSAPLYGALGIDRFVLSKPGAEVRAKGRLDLVRRGIGIDMEIGGEGITADDLKRLWPYFISSEGRTWFVNQVTGGTVLSSTMKLNYPVGSFVQGSEQEDFPKDAVSIDLVGVDVRFKPVMNMDAIAVRGAARLAVRDASTSVHMDNLAFPTAVEPVNFSNAAVIIDGSDRDQSIIEISGDVVGSIPALIDLAETHASAAIGGLKLPVKPSALNGTATGRVVANLVFDRDGEMARLDYAANGEVDEFSSTEPLADRAVSDGKLFFNASSEGYKIQGTAKLDGLNSEFSAEGTLDGTPDIRVSSTVNANDLKKFGFDASAFLSGDVRFVGKPLEDGGLQVAVDLTDAELTLADIGLAKPSGVKGTLTAELHQKGELSEITQIALDFADVRLNGALEFDNEEGLVSANFSTFGLSEGDDARLEVAAIKGGYAVKLSGEQFDLKPMLKRYFAVDQTSTGGPQSSSIPQTIILDAKIKRALGHYGVTAYNFDLHLNLKGENLKDTSLQTQFGADNSVSIITNAVDKGRVMSVAVNDAGMLLRFLNVYPRLLGGAGSLVMTTDDTTNVHVGEIRLKDFAIVDEEKVAQVLGNHKDSMTLIAKENRVKFDDARVNFIRRSDRIEITDGTVDGGSIGGTLRGFVYTKAREYDLTGTYVPLFALNNIFQKLPIIGQLMGGREGEGLVGVTFAVRGPLDKPDFAVNPASILAPGLFRSIFEFRAKEAPREGQ